MPWRPLPEPRGEELPRPIADGLDTVARRLGVARPAVLSVVFRRWPEIAGDVIARHVRPVGVRAGILYLEADDAAWAQEVTFLGDELRSRLAVALGTVERLELRVKVARPASARPSTRRRPSRSDGD